MEYGTVLAVIVGGERVLRQRPFFVNALIKGLSSHIFSVEYDMPPARCLPPSH